MSTMDTTRDFDLPIPSFRQLAVVVALVAAIAVGVFAGLNLTGTDSGTATGSGAASLDQPAAGNCTQQAAVEGGLLTGNERPDTCGDAGGGRPVEGLQP